MDRRSVLFRNADLTVNLLIETVSEQCLTIFTYISYFLLYIPM